MSNVSVYWADSSFRKAVGRLVMLDTDQMATLHDVTKSHFNLSASDRQRLNLSESEVAPVLAALRSIYQAGRDANYTSAQLLEELESLKAESELADISLEGKRSAMLDLFAPRPEHDKEQERQQVRAAPLPMLTAVDFFVDLRAVEEEGSDEQVRFVPVVLARFFADEPNVGMTLQLTKNSLDQLKRSLEKAQELLKAAEAQVGDLVY